MSIKYYFGWLSPADTLSRKSDYEDKDIRSNEKTWIKQAVTNDVIIFSFTSMINNHIWEEEKMRPWVFLLIGNKNDNENIITHITLQKAEVDKSVYKETLLVIQIAI